ncbi:MFS general substrate transporter [Aureobasidium pullulans EXF-150]|uniref:MFS general substrate transporter n=1 Tax=Aureobasidium pullulans EXF-150 TaxID=1043002 RepID=A0A074XL73_AURPU|nr:MFS general substrate transporter [Aureobasidium pullulans EXF-150]KEQ86265.1 MFS general substrate transporter [Aureobasidium pullulans EXF-150]
MCHAIPEPSNRSNVKQRQPAMSGTLSNDAVPRASSPQSQAGTDSASASVKSRKDGRKTSSYGEEEKDLGLPVLEGWPLGSTVFALCLALLLATLDTTIISTSLITIASDFGHFDQASWIIVSYLLTYSGFLLIFTRLSDVLGRKPVLMFSILMFLVWSIGCGFSQTLKQLIVFRALQGIGGAGIYALAYASVLDVVPFRLVSAASGAISMSTACASLLGPVLGGVITSNTTWRWVFWINIPCGVLVTVCVAFLFPNETHLFVVLMLVGSVICFLAFGIWEHVLTPREASMKMLPLFPTRLISSRVVAATLGTVFFTGFPFVVTIMALPQRLQIVNGVSPENAGLHMLPLIGSTALGAILTGTITGKFNIAWHLLVFSNVLMTVGCGLMSTLPTDSEIANLCYLYQIILGFGFGLTMASSMVVIRTEVAMKDNTVSLGAVTQLRQLGGVIGLAVTQAILNGDFRSQLAKFLSDEELRSVMLSTANIANLSDSHRDLTCRAYGRSSNAQMRVVTAFAGAAILMSMFARQNAPRDRKALEAERVAFHTGRTTSVELHSGSVTRINLVHARLVNKTETSSAPYLVDSGGLIETTPREESLATRF